MFKIAGVLLVACAVLLGQTFEVASVKPSGSDAQGGIINYRNGTFHATGITAKNCIALAYDFPSFQLAGGPGWIGDQRYDIVAKMPAGVAVPPPGPERQAQMRMALQALLADRFQLVIHRETKIMPAYVLVAAKNGFKLKDTTQNGRGSFSFGPGKFKAQGISIADLARNLSGILNSPVADQTGIKGIFDLTLEWSTDSSDAAEPSLGPSLFTAMQEQTGLKLETQKAPVEMIVIDRIEKPTAN